jgi:hypothetical protein
MRKSYFVLYALAALVVLGWATYYIDREGEAEHPGLACAGERVATYGWTHEDEALAEMAAILRWKRETEKLGESYAEWHNARGRYLQCRTIGGPDGHYQCEIAALPCRLSGDEDSA